MLTYLRRPAPPPATDQDVDEEATQEEEKYGEEIQTPLVATAEGVNGGNDAPEEEENGGNDAPEGETPKQRRLLRQKEQYRIQKERSRQEQQRRWAYELEVADEDLKEKLPREKPAQVYWHVKLLGWQVPTSNGSRKTGPLATVWRHYYRSKPSRQRTG